MNILILTGKFGMGHVSAAKSIEADISRQLPGAQAVTVDFLAYALKSDALYKAFELLVSHGEQVFNRFYYRSEADRIGVPMRSFCFAALGRLLALHRPDVVISTLPLTTQIAGQYKAEGRGSYTLAVSVTDTAVHSDWVTPAADAYLAACPETRQGLIEAGIAAHSIFVTGVPIGADFYPAAPETATGLDQTRKLLVLGGGLGLISDSMDFYARLDALPGVETTVICGHNQRLLGQLEGRFEHIHPLGFVTDMAEHMRAAHLALGKPGGVTLFEAVACHLPFLSVKPFLAQEGYNARFVETHGLGAVLQRGAEDSVEDIRRLIWDDRRLGAAQVAMARLEAGFDRQALVDILQVAARAPKSA